MRLWELFESISPSDVDRLEKHLDAHVYQPADKVAKREPVIDLDLPKGRSHFMQRLVTRADKAGITLPEIYRLLKRAKEDPSLGVSKRIERAATAEDPHFDITIRSEDDLIIPFTVRENPQCSKTQPGNPVCSDHYGRKMPRNRMIAKTIYRKGVDD